MMIQVHGVLPFLVLSLVLPPAARSAPCTGGQQEIHAGIPDGFALPTEAVYQTPDFAEFLTDVWYPGGQGPRVFDQFGYDLALAHSFTDLGTDVCAASLEVRVRADGSLCDNDSIRLAYTGANTVADGFAYWTTFRSLVGGTWPPGSDAVFTFDLADLPPRTGFPTNILSELQDGGLEILVEDDSSVDYAILRVCRCAVSVDSWSWGRVKAGYTSRSE